MVAHANPARFSLTWATSSTGPSVACREANAGTLRLPFRGPPKSTVSSPPSKPSTITSRQTSPPRCGRAALSGSNRRRAHPCRTDRHAPPPGWRSGSQRKFLCCHYCRGTSQPRAACRRAATSLDQRAVSSINAEMASKPEWSPCTSRTRLRIATPATALPRAPESQFRSGRNHTSDKQRPPSLCKSCRQQHPQHRSVNRIPQPPIRSRRNQLVILAQSCFKSPLLVQMTRRHPNQHHRRWRNHHRCNQRSCRLLKSHRPYKRPNARIAEHHQKNAPSRNRRAHILLRSRRAFSWFDERQCPGNPAHRGSHSMQSSASKVLSFRAFANRLQQPSIFFTQRSVLQQIGPIRQCLSQLLLSSPFSNLLMISIHQHLRRAHPAKLRRRV